MTDEQEITPAEQRVLDAIEVWHRGGLGMHTNDGRWMEKRRAEKAAMLAALREYGAEQRLQGYTAGHRDAGILADYEANDG